jgi:hypothetical protein
MMVLHLAVKHLAAKVLIVALGAAGAGDFATTLRNSRRFGVKFHEVNPLYQPFAQNASGLAVIGAQDAGLVLLSRRLQHEGRWRLSRAALIAGIAYHAAGIAYNLAQPAISKPDLAKSSGRAMKCCAR